jgi:uncharacterized protein (UPF0248 family)
MSVRSARDLLLKTRWEEGLGSCRVIVLDRLAKDGTSELPGEMIIGVGRHYFELEGTRIPYHRVVEVLKDGAVVWSRVKVR